MISDNVTINSKSSVVNPKCEKLAEKLISSGRKTRDFFEAIDGECPVYLDSL